MKILNRNHIKYIAIAAMLVDHIAWLFVKPFTPAWGWMHFFGRITGPAMAVFLAEGYHHTKDVDKYTARLGVFALISWPCYSLMETGRIGPHFGVIFTLFLAMLALRLSDSECHIAIKLAGIAGLCVLSTVGDWAIFDILFALCAHVFYERKALRWGAHCFISAVSILFIFNDYMSLGWPWQVGWYELGEFLVPLIFCVFYSGEPGSHSAFNKWFFYVFYPLHLLVLWYFASLA